MIKVLDDLTTGWLVETASLSISEEDGVYNATWTFYCPGCEDLYVAVGQAGWNAEHLYYWLTALDKRLNVTEYRYLAQKRTGTLMQIRNHVHFFTEDKDKFFNFLKALYEFFETFISFVTSRILLFAKWCFILGYDPIQLRSYRA